MERDQNERGMAMNNEKGLDENDTIDTHLPNEKIPEVTGNTVSDGDHRIQFSPNARPPARHIGRKEHAASSIAPTNSRAQSISSTTRRAQSISSTRRSQSIAPIPRVVTAEEKRRHERQKEEEARNVDVDEHLMALAEVAGRYSTRIDEEKPGASLGLSNQQAEELLQTHGPNILTPRKQRHPFLKYLDNLTSLFNLLLIFAGVLEYILLGIDYKNNFQNVSFP